MNMLQAPIEFGQADTCRHIITGCHSQQSCLYDGLLSFIVHSSQPVDLNLLARTLITEI